jgi:hypothetical protein
MPQSPAPSREESPGAGRAPRGAERDPMVCPAPVRVPSPAAGSEMRTAGIGPLAASPTVRKAG